MRRRVIVGGVGLVSPLGNRDAFCDRLLAGESGVAPITAFDVSACRTRVAALVTGFDPAAWIPPMKLRRMDNTARYAVVVTRQAFEEGGALPGPDGDDQSGVVLGTFTAGGQPTSEYLTALHRLGPSGAPALLFNSTVGNAPASLAGLEFKLRGPNVTISQKEASGLGAIVAATDALRLGRATALVAGGVDAIFEIFFRVHDRFAVMAATADAAGPFDTRREGFLLGEGGYAVLLQSEERWRCGAGPILGEILGVGAGSADVGINRWPSDPRPIVRTMRAALVDAAVEPSEVTAVFASADGSPALDRVEARALTHLFGSSGPPITSIKGAVGECGASGAAAVVAALLCGARREIPPIARFAEADAAAAELLLVRERTPMQGSVVLVNSIASGGSLFAVVLRVGS